MYVFIDDSGDTGFKLDGGSSQHVVLAACIFRSQEDLKKTISLIDSSRIKNVNGWQEQRFEREYKYHKTKKQFKDEFFEAIKPAKFDVRAIIIDKTIIYSPNLRTDPDRMKRFMVEQLLTHTLGTVKDAKVIIDGQDKQAFGLVKESSMLKDSVNSVCPGTIRELEFADSKRSALIQLADMTAGAIRRAELRDEDAMKHRGTLSRRMDYPNGSLWRFQ